MKTIVLFLLVCLSIPANAVISHLLPKPQQRERDNDRFLINRVQLSTPLWVSQWHDFRQQDCVFVSLDGHNAAEGLICSPDKLMP